MPEHTFLWLLKQNTNTGFDTFDSCVVAADTKEEAIEITPHDRIVKSMVQSLFGKQSRWAIKKEDVIAEKIGVCHAKKRGMVIITSFNAG